MGLTASDLNEIRSIVREEFSSIDSELKALRDDINEIYDIIRYRPLSLHR